MLPCKKCESLYKHETWCPELNKPIKEQKDCIKATYCSECGGITRHMLTCPQHPTNKKEQPIEIVREPIIIISEEQAKMFINKFDVWGHIALSSNNIPAIVSHSILKEDYIVRQIRSISGIPERHPSSSINRPTDRYSG